MAMTPEGRAALDELRQEAGLDESLPWGGRSPRALTRAHKIYILRHEASPPEEDAMLEDQYRRFLWSYDQFF